MAQPENFKQQLAIRKERLAMDFLQKKTDPLSPGAPVKKMGNMSDLRGNTIEHPGQPETQRVQLENQRLLLENQRLQLELARLKLLNTHMLVQLRKLP